jgi:hypothetical protein
MADTNLGKRYEHDAEADATGAKLDHQERMRAVARILEILRGGGYHCELEQQTLH